LKCGQGDWTNRKIRLPPTTILKNKNLWDLVDSTSVCALRALKVDLNIILHEDPTEWNDRLQYLKTVEEIRSLKVVNDTAERAIKLITQCSSARPTKNETELQKIVQIIEDNRKRLPEVSKQALATYKTR
jgi:hypothetical protein